MAFKLRSSNAANVPLTWTEMDNNLIYLLTNMSGSNISLLGPSSVTGSLTISGSGTILTLFGTASVNNILPYTNNVYNLGSSGLKWNTVYATTFSGSLNGTATNASTASNITPAITNDTAYRVLTSNGDGTLNAEVDLTFNGSDLNLVGGLANGSGNSISSGYSHAEGFNTEAANDYSHAEGEGTITYGAASHAEGQSTIAFGDYSHAEGQNTLTQGSYSHAEGAGTIASGSYSHAEGSNTLAFGYYSHAEGYQVTSSGLYSHAEGYLSNAIGIYSHAEGLNNISYGDHSHAEGASTIASGSYSHAEGSSTIARGPLSHAEGISTLASGTGSHAEGDSTIASGNYAHAEGYNTRATGNYSHVDGLNTAASATGSYAGGAYANSSHAYEWSRSNTSLGQYGTITLSAQTSNATPTQLSIGGTGVDYFTIPTNTAYYVDLTLMAFNPNTLTRTWNGKANIYNNAGTVAIDGTGFIMNIVTGSLSGGGIAIAVAADNTNDRLAISVTGSIGSDIRWFAKADYIKLG